MDQERDSDSPLHSLGRAQRVAEAPGIAFLLLGESEHCIDVGWIVELAEPPAVALGELMASARIKPPADFLECREGRLIEPAVVLADKAQGARHIVNAPGFA